jgi:bifunctional DNase/RNase
MVEVTIDSIRVGLVSQRHLIVLRDTDRERFFPICIGPYEAEAIRISLKGVASKRPLAYDLLNMLIAELGASVSHVLVNRLHNDTCYVRIVIDIDGRPVEIDSRPSDAIAIAVRANVPIFVTEEVMGKVSIVPDKEIEPKRREESKDLMVFYDFINSLEMD